MRRFFAAAARNQSMFTPRLLGIQGVRWAVAGALTAAVALLLTGSASTAPNAAPDRVTGWRVQLEARS